MSIPAMDMLVAHEQAAMEIGELRRKGIHCHLEEHADESGHHVEVVREAVAACAGQLADGEAGEERKRDEKLMG
jgi:hypothetical protein